MVDPAPRMIISSLPANPDIHLEAKGSLKNPVKQDKQAQPSYVANALQHFGEALINASNPISTLTVPERGERELMKAFLTRVYGSGFSDMYDAVNETDVPLSGNRLNRDPKTGFALGVALDFAARYLTLADKSDDMERVVAAASRRFADGVPTQAEINQIIFDGQDIEEVKDNLNASRQQPIRKLQQGLQEWIATGRRLTTTRQAAVTRKMQEFEQAMTLRISRTQDELNQLRLTPLARYLGLKLDNTTLPKISDVDAQAPQKEFLEHIAAQTGGCYLFICNGKQASDPQYPVVLIKDTNERGYLFDPSFGVVEILGEGELGKRVWADVVRYYGSGPQEQQQSLFKLSQV